MQLNNDVQFVIEMPLRYKTIQLEKMVFNFRDIEYSIERLSNGEYAIVADDLLHEFQPEMFTGTLQDCVEYLKNKLGIKEPDAINFPDLELAPNETIFQSNLHY